MDGPRLGTKPLARPSQKLAASALADITVPSRFWRLAPPLSLPYHWQYITKSSTVPFFVNRLLTFLCTVSEDYQYHWQKMSDWRIVSRKPGSSVASSLYIRHEHVPTSVELTADVEHPLKSERKLVATSPTLLWMIFQYVYSYSLHHTSVHKHILYSSSYKTKADKKVSENDIKMLSWCYFYRRYFDSWINLLSSADTLMNVMDCQVWAGICFVSSHTPICR